MVASVFLFSSKTEQSRVVTIQRPLVITQERKSPAFYAYQQAQKLNERKPAAVYNNAPSTHLSTYSIKPEKIQLQVTEMKLSKREFATLDESGMRIAVFSNPLQNDFMDPAHERVVAEDFVTNEQKADMGSAVSALTPEATVLSPDKKWATIKGKFELIDGVGIVDHYIEIRRIEEGISREVGQIDLMTGSYAIEIESPQGYLVAQVRDRSTGGLVGEDRARLFNLQSKGQYFEGPFIRVGQPPTLAINLSYSGGNGSGGSGKSAISTKSAKAVVPDSASTFSSAVNSVATATLFDNQNTLAQVNDKFSNIGLWSATISRFYDPSRVYKNVTTIRQTADKNETSVFTSKWIEGVVEYVADLQKISYRSKNAPILIGRVLVDGKPVAGAEVMIESHLGLQPIYFDQFMIPSISAKTTSENGYFMFVGLDVGAYKVSAIRRQQALGGQMFLAEADAIAFQNIAAQSTLRSKTLRSFDAFSSELVETEAYASESQADVIETNGGKAQMQSYAETGLSEVIVKPQDARYLSVRYNYNSRQDYLHLPQVQEEWLLQAIRTYKINVMPQSGVIIGFTRDLVYDAYLVSESFSKNDVLYFDSTGHVTTTLTTGGGFILFNVPVGMREVVLQERKTDRIFSQVFNVLDHQISVSHFQKD